MKWVILLALAVASPASAQGARVIDGDTFEVQGKVVRILNIDAPEAGQSCTDAKNRTYDCGNTSARALEALLSKGGLHCQSEDRDQYGRVLARCSAGGRDIGAAMVANGHALAFTRYSNEYLAEQIDAQKAGRGVWAGDITAPWEFRSQKWSEKVQANPGKDCVIKGNINGRGEKIYHMPYDAYYTRTRISTSKGERWFCNERDAKRAGWRRARK